MSLLSKRPCPFSTRINCSCILAGLSDTAHLHFTSQLSKNLEWNHSVNFWFQTMECPGLAPLPREAQRTIKQSRAGQQGTH